MNKYPSQLAIVELIRYRLSRDFAASVSKVRFQMPRQDQRLKRL